MKNISELADEVMEEMKTGTGFRAAIVAVLTDNNVKENWNKISSQIKVVIEERGKAVFTSRQKKDMERDSYFLSLRRGDDYTK